MQLAAFIKCLSAELLSNTSLFATPLAFNPIKLAALIGWVYACLYIVHRIQFSPLVPKSQKTTASIIALVLGPILVIALLIVFTGLLAIKTVSKSAEEHGLKERLQNAIANLRSSYFIRPDEDMTIKLLDSSGRNIKEIYTYGKGKKQGSHILDLTEQIIWNALKENASDILVDPKGDSVYTIRLRIDGVLREVEQIDADTSQAVINSIKAVSSMDIAEKRRPQDGSFIAKTPKQTVSFRVASAGAINGEKLSIRVLNQNSGIFTLNNIGLSEKQRTIIKEAIGKPSGMILMCGPTGSGKTTTLYAMLNEIDLFVRNVITVEDPIEYILPNASQIEVNPKADITFAKSLRSILRQDPDVICVGEIRDQETAGIALQAAQTGHLVLATLHCNSTASSLIRLFDLGVSPLLMSSGLNLIIAQRLVRRLCSHCKQSAQLSQSQIHELRRKNINYKNIFQPKGCEMCYGTGYRSRIAVFDLLALDNNLKANIANNKLSITHLRKEGDKRGQSNLQKQGLKKVVSGITSLDELKRVIG